MRSGQCPLSPTLEMFLFLPFTFFYFSNIFLFFFCFVFLSSCSLCSSPSVVSSSEISDVDDVMMMMTTMHQTFANDDTFLLVSRLFRCLAAKIQIKKTKRRRRKNPHFSRWLYSFSISLFCLFLSAISLDPSTSSSYDSSTVQTACASPVSIRWGAHAVEKKRIGKSSLHLSSFVLLHN